MVLSNTFYSIPLGNWFNLTNINGLKPQVGPPDPDEALAMLEAIGWQARRCLKCKEPLLFQFILCCCNVFFCVLGNHQGFFWRPWSLLKSQVDRNFQQDHSKGRCDLVQNFHAAVALTLGWSQKSTLSVGTAVSQHFQLQCEKAKNRTLKSRKIWRLSNTERLKRWVFFCGASAKRIERRDANWKNQESLNLSLF